MWETWSLGGGCRHGYGHGHGCECVPGDQVRVVKVGLHGEKKKMVVARAVSFHLPNSQALGESLGLRAWLGLADPQAGPWACQSRHQGLAWLRLLGLGCLGFRALSRAMQNTNGKTANETETQKLEPNKYRQYAREAQQPHGPHQTNT